VALARRNAENPASYRNRSRFERAATGAVVSGVIAAYVLIRGDKGPVIVLMLGIAAIVVTYALFWAILVLLSRASGRSRSP
jgi:hypothetical protein